MHDVGAAGDHLGSLSFRVFEFPSGVVPAEGFRRLLALVDAHLIQVLDLEFIGIGADGSSSLVAAHDVAIEPSVPLDLAQFDGAASGILTSADIAEAARGAQPGSVVAVLLIEDLTLSPVVDAFEQAGAYLVGEGAVLPEDLLEALDATETIDR